jgi:hypothetical protein
MVLSSAPIRASPNRPGLSTCAYPATRSASAPRSLRRRPDSLTTARGSRRITTKAASGGGRAPRASSRWWRRGRWWSADAGRIPADAGVGCRRSCNTAPRFRSTRREVGSGLARRGTRTAGADGRPDHVTTAHVGGCRSPLATDTPGPALAVSSYESGGTAVTVIASSMLGWGRAKRYPCASSQPNSRSRWSCSGVSTPSAMERRPS